MKKLTMVEIYSGKDQEWKGWHNLILELNNADRDSYAIQGPINPEVSKHLIEIINELNKG